MACTCNNTLGNTGRPNCESLMDVAAGLFITPYYDDNGAQNYIDVAATLNAAYFTTKLNAAAGSRWHPLQNLKNVVDERGDNILETFEDNSVSFVQVGPRTFRAWIIGTSTTFLSKIAEYNCIDTGTYIRDKQNNLIGTISSDETKLYPIRIEKGTWSAKLIKGTDKTKQKTEISFQFHVDERDEDLRMISADEITGVTLSSLNGLLDVTGTLGTVGTTSLVVTLKTDYGTAVTKDAVTGLVAADFEIYNVTDSSAVTVTGATESTTTEGEYTLTYAAVTAADSLRVSLVKNGYEMDDVTGSAV